MIVNNIRKSLFLTILMNACILTSAQVADSLFDIEDIMDCIEDIESENFLESITEELIEKIETRESKLPNINNLDYEEAINMLKISDYQYYQLQVYIEKFGELYTIYELLTIEGFSDKDLKRLWDLVEVRPPPKVKKKLKDYIKNGKHLFLLRYSHVLEKAVGYDKNRNNHYDGSPFLITFRYEFSSFDKFGIKIAGIKDPGDCFFRGAQKYGFDRYSGSIFIKNIKLLKYAVVGDFRVNYGQGLVLGNSLFAGKGASVDGLRKFDEGLRAVAITSEGGVLRGCGFTLGDAKTKGCLFAGEVTNSKYSAIGAAFKHARKKFKFGAQFAILGESHKDSSFVNKWNALTEKRIFNASIDYSTILGNQLIFGEIAINETKKLAFLQSAVLAFTPELKMGITFRHYHNGYNSALGTPFKANSLGCGETGLYFTCNSIITKRLETIFFADFYQLHYLSYRTDSPIQGIDLGTTFFIQFSRKSKVNAKYRWRNRPKNENLNIYLHRIIDLNSHKIKIQWENKPYTFLKLKTEVNIVLNKFVDNIWKRGFLTYQDIGIMVQKPDINLNFRLAYFDTDSYEERLYAYENDLYYTFNIGSYFYRGTKYYIMVRYKIRNFSFWIRASRTYYFDKNKVGSGLNQIDKPHKTELKAQVLMRF